MQYPCTEVIPRTDFQDVLGPYLPSHVPDGELVGHVCLDRCVLRSLIETEEFDQFCLQFFWVELQEEATGLVMLNCNVIYAG